jgi:Ras-related protein Rab-1A
VEGRVAGLIMASRPKCDHVLKIVLEGDLNVGKTKLLLRMTEDPYSEGFEGTIGTDFRFRVAELDGKVVKCIIWDKYCSGEFRNSYFRGALGVMLVYDITDRESFMNLERRWLSDIQRYCVEDVVVLVIGNKTDLEAQRVVSFEEGKALADSYRASFIETSAKNSANVEAAFMSLLVKAKAAYDRRNEGQSLMQQKPDRSCVCF